MGNFPATLIFINGINEAVDSSQALDKIKDFILIFTSIFYEALPFIVIGSLLAGFLEELLPQKLIARLLPRNRFFAILIGALLGLIFPMCECGIIPVMRRLLRKGLPLSCCVAYLLAGPIINPLVLLSTYVAFDGMENATENGTLAFQMGGLAMVLTRTGMAYLVSVGTSLIVDRLHQKYGDDLLLPLAKPPVKSKLSLDVVDDDEVADKGSMNWFARASRISETALHDFIDITVFLTIGALLAAFTRIWLTHDAISELSRTHIILAVLLMMLLSVILCLCSEADAFVAASFVTLRPAAKAGFLVLGPMFDLKLYMMYTRVFKPRLIWTIIISVVIQVFIYTMILHGLWENLGPRLFFPKTDSITSTVR